jgi:hypothetical protein
MRAAGHTVVDGGGEPISPAWLSRQGQDRWQGTGLPNSSKHRDLGNDLPQRRSMLGWVHLHRSSTETLFGYTEQRSAIFTRATHCQGLIRGLVHSSRRFRGSNEQRSARAFPSRITGLTITRQIARPRCSRLETGT